ncbi:MAG: LysR family transcriptional regulator [Oscillospiraceae bacterium]|nr:LysR family transcriptional regulator [Oscillospiraceae bacterium]
MTLSQLQYFQTLAHVLHYTRAAEALHIAQPSLSYAIGELEKELNVKLFVKEDRRVSLTMYGEQFLPYVETALATLSDGTQAVRQMADAAYQVVKMGYFHSISASFIPKVVEALYGMEENKKLRFQFSEASSADTLRLLKSGSLDLAFCMHRDEWVESVPVMQQRLYLAVPQGHRLAGYSEVSFEDFADEPMAMLDQASSLRTTVDRIFLHYGSKRSPNAVFVVHECNAALQYVSLGFCVSILPKVPAMSNDKVVVLPIRDPDGEFSRTVYFSWLRNRPLSPAVKRVRSYVVEHYRLTE